MSNIVTAKFCSDQTRAWTDELWQYDYGQILKFDGLELPDAYEVHFSNQPLTGETITQIGNADGVTIPDQFLQSGEVVYAWVYLHTGEDDGETEYMVTIPVSKRPEPSDEQPTPVEQSAIDQAIAALNTAVEKTAADVAEADEAAEQAAASEQAAQIAATEAGSYVDTVTAKANEAAASASAASQSASAADQSASDAAESAAETASGIARAEQAADDAEAAKTSAQAAQTAAEATVGQAEEYAVAAAGSATAASTSATQAAGSATSASGFAGDANTYAQAAAASATTAATKAGEASQSATTASTAATNAGNAQTAAETAQGKAEDAQEAAEDAQTAAETAAASIQQSAAQIAQNTSDIADLTDDINHKVSDVKINGTSIVDANKEADIPLADTTNYGVLKTNGDFGLLTNVLGEAYLNRADDAQIKAGNHAYRPIVPREQHKSVFYALAKASGDTTQSSSSNPVGTYTETAKQKINAMLEPQFRLIKTINITSDTGYFHILADDNNNPFSLTELILYFDSILGSSSGNVGISVNSGTTVATNAFLTVQNLLHASTPQNRVAHLEVRGGKFFGTAIASQIAQNYSPVVVATSLNATGIIACSNIEEIYIKSLNGYDFTGGTITIYGR